MIKIYIPMFLLCIFATTFAQTPANKISEALKIKINIASATDEILVWVYFTDKGRNTDVYFSNPELVVSKKSIKRREKVFSKSAPLTMRDIPVNSDYISQVKSKGLKVKWPSKWLNAVSGTVSKAQLNEIASLTFVKKLDIVYKLRKGNQPETDQNSVMQSLIEIQQPRGVNIYDYGDSYAQLQQINVPAAHDSGYTGQGVTICLMDAGFNRLSHDAFLFMNIIAAWDFVNNDPNVGNEGDMGDGSHGTMTLSTIGGFAPGYLIGPAFNSSYILAKTENTDSETPIEEDNWIAAMEWADSIGVDITSTSLSYLDYDPPYPSYTWMDMDGNTTVITNGADYAVFIGIIVVNSAGNYGYNASHNTLGAPADGDSVITAGAVDISGSRSSFSSVGPTVDGRFKPDIMALGSGDVVASPYNDNNYTTASGTSFSCPLSAGVAALILCSNPNLTPMEVRDAMRNTASQSNNPDNLYGWGILNALDAINYFSVPDSTFQLTVSIEDGWNMVSIPGLHPANQDVTTWWSGLTGSVFTYNSGYFSVTTATPTEGYWLKHIGSNTYNTGDEWPASGIIKVPNDPFSRSEGWNIIGVYECPVAAVDIQTIPPGCFGGVAYRYSAGYQIVDTLYPGYAYWINLLCSSQIVLPPCGALNATSKIVEFINKDWGKIIITDNAGRSYTLYAVNGEVNLDNYELPPMPPVGMFDVRFGSDRIAEDINSSIQSIEMSGIEHPVRIKVENMSITLQDESGKEINAVLEPGEEITIENNLINKLLVSSGEVVAPIEYALEQNYPNPFNPNTTIKFEIPKESNVNLSIYNVLGELVTTLVNEQKKPGYYEYKFDASNLASGVYLYRIKAVPNGRQAGDPESSSGQGFVETKKMVLLR